jgi:hypothetical protein
VNRVHSREELSRTLALYGAFTASGRIMDGDDQEMLEYLQRLRVRLDDERGEVIERVIRGLRGLMASAKESESTRRPLER